MIRDELPEWYETAVHANKGSVPAKHTMETRFAKVHASEWKWVGYDFDYVIKNESSLDDLQEQVINMHNDIKHNQSKFVSASVNDNVINISDKD